MNQPALSAFIWSVADLLRGDYKQSEYGKVILPFTVLRRLDCVLEMTKAAVLTEHDDKLKMGLNAEPFLLQLIDASGYWQKMRKSLGSKRKELSDEHIAEITRLSGQFIEAYDGKKPISRIFKNSAFGYRTITVERPLRDENGNIVPATKGKLKGKPQPDSNLRDTENVPLHEDIETYFKREVLPHAPDAWIDHDKTKVGYEIPFNRHFYVFEPPRPLSEIDADLKQCTGRILTMIAGLSA
jgi:type I restriction enzyme M protein